jgi:hypothetical protein
MYGIDLLKPLCRDPERRRFLRDLHDSRTPGVHELTEPFRPGVRPRGRRDLRFGQEARGEKRVLEFVGIPRVGPCFRANPLNGGDIERAKVVCGRWL